jgi:hypothetical protein
MSQRLVLAALAAATLMSACGRAPATAASPSTSPPTATYQAAASPTSMPAPTHLPGTAVRIAVNGAELKQGATAQVDGETPALIVITFPMAMNRASVERWLPRSASISWTDDRTVELSIPASENNLSFKAPESLSADGSTIVDLFFVSLTLPPSIVVSTFSVDELLAGGRSPREPAVRVSAVDALRFSPDGRKVLMYQTAERRPTGHSPRIFDLRSHSTVTLPVPQEASGALLFGEWAGNDRVVLVGEAVWVGAADGSAMRKVADLRGLGMPHTAAVSPLGSSVALGWSDRLLIVGLDAGSMRTIAGHHDNCANRSGPRLAWSNDDALLAAIECDASAPTARVRIVDAASGRTLRTVDGGDLGITSLLTGGFALPRESGEQGEGSRRLFVVFSFEGIEKARYLGHAPTLSPDGRYLLDGTCCAGEGFVITDLRAPDPSQPAIAGRAMWLSDGRVLVLQGTAGVR